MSPPHSGIPLQSFLECSTEKEKKNINITDDSSLFSCQLFASYPCMRSWKKDVQTYLIKGDGFVTYCVKHILNYINCDSSVKEQPVSNLPSRTEYIYIYI